EVGTAADVYSLGAILYRLLTGRPPFQASNTMDTLLQVLEREVVPVRQLNLEVNRDLETICLKCLQKGPQRRYQSARALAEDLGPGWRGEPIWAGRVGRAGRTWRWCRRKPVLAASLGLAGALFLVIAVGGPIVAVQEARLRSQAEESAEAAKRARMAEADRR